MGLGVGERKCRAPGAAEHLPALYSEMLAQLLDIVDEMPGGVLVDAGMRRRAPASALVEQHDAVAVRIVIASHDGGRAAAGAAMQQHGGFAVGISAFLVVKFVKGRDLEPSRAVRNDLRIEAVALADRILTLIHVVPILHDGAPLWEGRLLACRGGGAA